MFEKACWRELRDAYDAAQKIPIHGAMTSEKQLLSTDSTSFVTSATMNWLTRHNPNGTFSASVARFSS